MEEEKSEHFDEMEGEAGLDSAMAEEAVKEEKIEEGMKTGIASVEEEKEAVKGKPAGPKVKKKGEKEVEKGAEAEKKVEGPLIFALRTNANREDQVMDFLVSNVKKRKLAVYSVIRPHGMRGYIFVEAGDRQSAEEAAFGIPYARGILPKLVAYSEIEHMLEQVKREVNIQKNDIVEIISGPFKREQAKVTRIDRAKEEVVVELLGAAVPIPITVKMDAVKVIRRETGSAEALEAESESVEE